MKTKLTILFFICYSFLFAQRSEGGKPYSFQHSSLQKNTVLTTILPEPNVDSLLAIPSEDLSCYKFGEEITVDIGFEKNNTWFTTEDGGRVWQHCIQTKNALSLNFIFDEFWLPEGATLFLYNIEKTKIIGAFTQKNNKPSNSFATEPIQSNSVILEYYEPSQSIGKGKLHLSTAVYGYRPFTNISNTMLSKQNAVQDCFPNVNCPEAKNWQYDKNYVVRFINGGGLCSAWMVNNVREDVTPYFISARHCSSPVAGQTYANYVILFNYESSTCNSTTDGSTTHTASGCYIVAVDAGTDFFLFKLLESIADKYEDWKIHFAGWSLDVNAPMQGNGYPTVVNIQHPAQREKKINYEYGSISNSGSNWNVLWDNGGALVGSSGSPLINSNHLVIGHTVTASSSTICNVNNETYYFGVNYRKFSSIWNGGGTPQTRVKDWLNPDNVTVTGLRSLATYNINVANETFIYPQKDLSGGCFNTTANITATNTIVQDSANVTFRAKGDITLQDGFHAKEGTEFLATIATSSQNNQFKFDFDNNTIKQRNPTSFVVTDFFISTNYPNPFNPTTTINYGLKENGYVELKIYNVIGQEIKTLINEEQTAGYKTITWDGTSNEGIQSPTGIYIYQIRTGTFTQSQKMMLLK